MSVRYDRVGLFKRIIQTPRSMTMGVTRDRVSNGQVAYFGTLWRWDDNGPVMDWYYIRRTR